MWNTAQHGVRDDELTRIAPEEGRMGAAALARHRSAGQLRSWSLLDGKRQSRHIGGAHRFFSMMSSSADTGAVVMSASDAHPLVFEALLAISDAEGWAGFRAPSSVSAALSRVAIRAAWIKRPR